MLTNKGKWNYQISLDPDRKFLENSYIFQTALKYGLFLEEQENMVNVYGKPVEW